MEFVLSRKVMATCVADETGITYNDSMLIVQNFIDIIFDGLVCDEELTIPGIGRIWITRCKQWYVAQTWGDVHYPERIVDVATFYFRPTVHFRTAVYRK